MSPASKRKVLLMGRSGSGKTSMRSVIFQQFHARDTVRLGVTVDVEQSAVRFLGSLVLNLWDCGGQNAFTDNYLTTQKDTIFANVAVLIYVFDITSDEWESDMRYFEDIIASLRDNSSDAGVWVLVNKMDLADKEDPTRKVFGEKRTEIMGVHEKVWKGKEKKGLIRLFGTTIWDESLYKAWSSVIHTLVPNINLITSHLTYLRDLCLAVEVAVFEAETFLIIAKSGSPLDANIADFDARETRGGMRSLDQKRFEKISDTIKAFRRTCHRTEEKFSGFEGKFDGCCIVMEHLTTNTYILVVARDPRVETAMIQHNIYHAQAHLSEFSAQTPLKRKCGSNSELKYEAAGDEDPDVPAWDDPGFDLDDFQQLSIAA